MTKKKTRTGDKQFQQYLAKKPRLECDYTEYGVMSYIVPARNDNGEATPKPKRKQTNRRKRNTPSAGHK
jgi:hypothetical protein